MNFLDEAMITVRSGNGGRGCISFRREKYVPRGGPDGGDGGDGGSVIARATRRRYTLTDFQTRRFFKAKNGEPGKSKNRSGRHGEDLILKVPPGTVIEDLTTGRILADLTQDQQEVFLAAGGKGGRGNQHYSSSVRRSPRIAQPGLSGEERRLRLSLKFLADIGLVGFPNAGKSTLLSRLSNARPKVAGYPFTTLVPNLGVMTLDNDRSLVVADIPGLIEGASRGKGLGDRFLKHIERTRLLVYLLDASYRPERDPLEDFYLLRQEMTSYGSALTRKPHIVIINKIDLAPHEKRNLHELREGLNRIGIGSVAISALTGDNIEAAVRMIAESTQQAA